MIQNSKINCFHFKYFLHNEHFKGEVWGGVWAQYDVSNNENYFNGLLQMSVFLLVFYWFVGFDGLFINQMSVKLPNYFLTKIKQINFIIFSNANGAHSYSSSSNYFKLNSISNFPSCECSAVFLLTFIYSIVWIWIY
jgi:hypothetical protein